MGDFEARHKVWTLILQRVAAHCKLDVESFLKKLNINTLAKPSVNGRQIKNCVRLSQALAVDNGQTLSQNLLESTLATICSFQRDLQDNDDANEEYTSFFAVDRGMRKKKEPSSCLAGFCRCFGSAQE